MFQGTATGTSAPLDQVLGRRGDASVTLPNPFYRQLFSGIQPAAGSKPDFLGIRARDAARALSMPLMVALPPGNILGDGTNPFTGAHLTAFDVARSPVSGATSTTLTATVTAPTDAAQSPFTQVCFYYAVPLNWGAEGGRTNLANFGATGDLVLIGCQATPTITQGPGPALDRLFTYTQTFTVPVTSPVVAGGTIFPIRAIGVNTDGDAIFTAPVNFTR
jgi:hypothetical protein